MNFGIWFGQRDIGGAASQIDQEGFGERTFV